MNTPQEILSRTYDTTVSKTVVFAGGTANDPGDFDGTGNPLTLFEVTGTVLMKLFARVNVDLTGASATVRAGTALSDAALLASTTATELDADEIWHDNAPDASIELSTVLTEKIVNQDVIQKVGTANVTAGSITYFCIWKSLSDGSRVEAS